MKTKALFKFLFIIMIIVSVHPLSVQANAAKQTAVIETDHLNVRSGPGTHFEQIIQVHEGEIYSVMQIEDNWIKIKLEEGTGWVAKEYITIKKTESSQSFEEIKLTKGSTFEIKYANTHIRKEPSLKSKIIHFADKGDNFDIVDIHNDWVKVKNDDYTGYIMKKVIVSSIPAYEKKLQNKIIVIDAGHGGYDVGAIGNEGTYEKDLTLQTAKLLKEKLTMFGAKVYLTRNNDYYLSLSSRASLANSLPTDLFMSIHYNSFPDAADISGISTYYYDEQHMKIANHVQNKLIEKTNDTDRGVTFEDFQVLRQNGKPALLLELGFISNAKTEQKILTNQYQEKLTDGMIQGINIGFTEQK
ncbi:N-acetylmuramoyl-L-alanine amidase [Virgibacillus sp. W0181]|uniref:N-acetylmuramoyl-L-alanine amidase n=1 Tax=Virgibacillus sp. W0181 TaxID=3391581 RepID=UPI003F458606